MPTTHTVITPEPHAETVTVHTRHVACDGGTLGHPKVYLHIGPVGEVSCPYCSRQFVLEGDGGDDH